MSLLLPEQLMPYILKKKKTVLEMTVFKLKELVPVRCKQTQELIRLELSILVFLYFENIYKLNRYMGIKKKDVRYIELDK